MDVIASYSSDSDESVVNEANQKATSSPARTVDTCTDVCLHHARKRARIEEQAATSRGMCLGGQHGCGALNKGNVGQLHSPSAFERARSFPHVEGNFATVVYIPVEEALSRRLHTLLHTLLAEHHHPLSEGNKHPPVHNISFAQYARVARLLRMAARPASIWAIAIPPIDAANTCTGQQPRQQCIPHQQVQYQLPLHMSLSRTVAVRHSQIDSLRASLNHELHPVKKFSVKLAGLTCLVNDNQSRSFVGIKAAAVQPQLLRVLGAVNRAFNKHGLPPFHQDPIHHVSLAWAAGNQAGCLQPWLDAMEHETLDFKVSQIICQIGKARHVVWQG